MRVPLKTKFFATTLLAILTLGLSGLMGQNTAAGTGPSAGGLATAVQTSDYKLMPSDLIQMRVFQEEDLTREVSVSQDFTISLPLIGTIDVKGKSLRQTEELIRQLYDRDYLVNPQITLVVLRYAERAVNVIGSVNAPQAVPFPPERGLTLLEAIARAGGFNRLANRTQVKIIRTDEKGVTTTFTVNAEHLIEGRSASSWPLEVDDVIEVPEKFL